MGYLNLHFLGEVDNNEKNYCSHNFIDELGIDIVLNPKKQRY